MKKTVLFLFLFCSASVFSQIRYDTITTMPVGSGIIYYKIAAPSVPWTFDVLKIDLKNPYNKIETVKGKDKLQGRETLSSMIKRNSSDDHLVVSAINADFFDLSTGQPINIQIKNGQILTGPISLSTIGFDNLQRPMIARVGYSGMIMKKEKLNAINSTNSSRGTDEMILFNEYHGTSTNTNVYGSEILVRPLSPWLVNDTILCVVENKVSGTGNMTIPAGMAVISGHGTSKAFIDNNISVTDTIKIVNSITPSFPHLKEMLGGYPRIVKDGRNYADQGYADEGGPDHTYQRNPRTAVGFSKDSTQLYFIVNDGRTSKSVGTTLPELADFMVKIGVYQGLNFDGGGSSEMIVRDNIMNVPSDGSERPVANALFVVSTAPKGELKNIATSPQLLKIFLEGSQKIDVKGFDTYYNPYPLSSEQLKYSLSKSSLGKISSNGLFTAGIKADTGYVRISYNDLKDSVLVIVKSVTKLCLYPNDVIIDTIKTVKYKLETFDMDGAPHILKLNRLKFSTADPYIAVIDTNGILRGRHEGTTKVICSFDKNVADTVSITVKVCKGIRQLGSFESGINKYFFENIDSLNSRIESSSDFFSDGTKSLKIQYQFKYDNQKLNFIHIPVNFTLEGVPDSVIVDFRSDGQKHFISFKISDDNAEYFTINSNKYASNAGVFDTLKACVANAAAIKTGSNLNYPITLKEITLKLGCPRLNGTVYNGTVYIDNLRITYPAKSSTSVASENSIVRDYELMQNYPNPFNPSTVISYKIPEDCIVSLRVYDLLGKEIMSIADGLRNAGTHKALFDASQLTSGIYFYIFKATPLVLNSKAGFISGKKMLLIK